MWANSEEYSNSLGVTDLLGSDSDESGSGGDSNEIRWWRWLQLLVHAATWWHKVKI